MDPSFLLIRLSALGDVLHGLPLLAALRRAHPDARIGWLVEDRAAPLLMGHPLLDELHVLPRRAWKRNPFTALAGPLRELHRDLRRAQYQTAIDLQGLTKSAFWAKLCGAPQRIGFAGDEAREVSRFFYNHPVHPPADRRHVVQRNLSLLASLGVDAAPVEFPVHLSTEDRAWSDWTWGSGDETNPRVVVNPGAGWPTKQWPAERYGELAAALARDIGARVAVAWGPGEEPLAAAALRAAGCDAGAVGADDAPPIDGRPGVYALPRSTFTRLGAIVARAHLFVGGDTGPTHLAAALDVPTLGLYGASDARRNGPWGKRSRSIQLTSPPCIPCWQTNCEYEPEPLACLKGIEVERARRLCLELLGG
jgi:lipopolysaccharide heptosyltransferase I